MITNNNRRTRCAYCQIKLTASNFDPRDRTDTCIDCFEQAGVENEHQDGIHDEHAEPNCPMCNPAADRYNRYVNNRLYTVTDKKVGHTNTAPKSHKSHAACYAIDAHPATPAGRAACRRIQK